MFTLFSGSLHRNMISIALKFLGTTVSFENSGNQVSATKISLGFHYQNVQLCFCNYISETCNIVICVWWQQILFSGHNTKTPALCAVKIPRPEEWRIHRLLRLVPCITSAVSSQPGVGIITWTSMYSPVSFLFPEKSEIWFRLPTKPRNFQ